MAKEVKALDVNQVPELLRLAQEVRATGQPQVLRGESDDVAVEIRVRPKARPRALRGRPLTYDDPLWPLVGSAEAAAPTDAAKKHAYLAETYAPPRP